MKTHETSITYLRSPREIQDSMPSLRNNKQGELMTIVDETCDRFNK